MGKKGDKGLVFRRVVGGRGVWDSDVKRKRRKDDIVMKGGVVWCVMGEMGLSMCEICDLVCIERSRI